jgi:hypothetical protein
MRRLTFIGLAALAMGMMGCTASIGEPEGSSNVGTSETIQGLVIDESTATTLRGRLGTADGQLSFSAIGADAEITLISLRVNGKTLDVTLDNGLVINDGHGAVLSPADHALLEALLNELGPRFVEPPSHVRSLIVNVAYLSEAPQGFVHTRYVAGESKVASFTGETPTSTSTLEGNEGVRCLRTGTTVTAVYDLANGTKWAEAVVVGSNWGTSVKGSGNYACMGRCGPGCFGNKYSKDCLDHDTCSHNVGATGGSTNPDCGDEYKAASDDYNGACTN